MLGSRQVKMQIMHDPKYLQMLVNDAKKLPTQAEQTAHILADESLSLIQRRAALDMLRKDKKPGIS